MTYPVISAQPVQRFDVGEAEDAERGQDEDHQQVERHAVEPTDAGVNGPITTSRLARAAAAPYCVAGPKR